ncbi:MAG: Spy/CpxP family protein refolding chaperone [Verrucomicrobiota bacterium]
MNTWKVVCATLVIFIAGILTGATLVRVAQGGPARWRIQRPVVDNRAQPNPVNPGNQNFPNEPRQPNPSGPAPGLLSREFIQILERQLRLTPEQHDRIDKIMGEGQERVRELRTRIDPELRKEMQQTREQIRAVLTPEQREQFEQLMKRSPRRSERGELPVQPDRRRDQHEPRSGQPLPPPPD